MIIKLNFFLPKTENIALDQMNIVRLEIINRVLNLLIPTKIDKIRVMMIIINKINIQQSNP